MDGRELVNDSLSMDDLSSIQVSDVFKDLLLKPLEIFPRLDFWIDIRAF